MKRRDNAGVTLNAEYEPKIEPRRAMKPKRLETIDRIEGSSNQWQFLGIPRIGRIVLTIHHGLMASSHPVSSLVFTPALPTVRDHTAIKIIRLCSLARNQCAAF